MGQMHAFYLTKVKCHNSSDLSRRLRGSDAYLLFNKSASKFLRKNNLFLTISEFDPKYSVTPTTFQGIAVLNG